MVELATAMLLALATVGSAWSAYQATRWGGIQSIKHSDASAARVESTRASTLGGQLAQIDAASFYPWLDAYVAGDERRAAFYYERLRGDFQVAVDAWLATEPLSSAGAPLLPFQLPEYELSELTESERLATEAFAQAQEARTANQRSDNYVLAVVLFASVLFFAGVAVRFKTMPAQLATVSAGILLFVGTTSWIATFPVSIKV